MNGKLIFLSGVCIILLSFLTGCGKDDVGLPDNIALSPSSSDSIPVSAAGGDFSVQFNSTAGWNATTDAPGWIEFVSPRSGKAGEGEIQIKVLPNTGYDLRKAYITIKGGSAVCKISVLQHEAGVILLTQKEYNLNYKETKIKLEFRSNIDFDVVLPPVDWVKELQTKAVASHVREYLLSENSNDDARDAEIVIKDKNSGLSDTVKILQTGLLVEKERNVLIGMYNTLGGRTWSNQKNWCSDLPVGMWEGVQTNASGRIIVLDVSLSLLVGTFPAEVCKLTELREFLMPRALSMSGEIPPEIGQLSHLEKLDLGGNMLGGSLPDEICNLVNLKYLNIGINAFTGTFPQNIGNLRNLEHLSIDKNHFSGAIPRGIANLSKISYLQITDNLFSGSIPAGLGSLSHLTCLLLSGNQLSGNIPEDLFYSASLEQLDLSNNKLTGPIPPNIGNAVNLKALGLHDNELSGSLPAGLAQIVGNIDWNSAWPVSSGIYNNNLSGTIPGTISGYLGWGKVWRRIVPQKEGAGFALTGVSLPGYTFTFRDIAGTGKSLSEIYKKNKYTVLLQWVNENYMIHELVSAYQKYHTAGFEVVAFTNPEMPGGAVETIRNSGMGIWNNYVLGYNGDYNTEIEGIVKNSTCKTVQAEVMDTDGNIVFSFQGGIADNSKFNKNTETELLPFLKEKLGEIPPPFYESTDFSEDGKVITLQEATVGKGINLVVMGDGFTDKDMGSDGKYETWCKEAVENYFSIEPAKSFRNRFNVYIVKAVSRREMLIAGAETALGCTFGNGTSIKGVAANCWRYAEKVTRNGDPILAGGAMIVAVLNSDKWAGTTGMFTGLSGSIAYCARPDNVSSFREIVCHEAVGHGLGKLGDEYYAPGSAWPFPDWKRPEYDNLYNSYGWYANLDFTNDPAKIRWNRFLADERYKGLVGIYEGGLVDYTHGVFRATESSIMLSGLSEFNAPSRNAIYKFIMELSGEDYSYEKFTDYDAVNRRSVSAGTRAMAGKDINRPPLAPPEIIYKY